MLKKNKFFNNVLILASGSMAAQLITFIASPLITRLFTVEQMGTYTLITTIVTMFGPIISLRYEMQIINEKEENIGTLLTLSLIIGFILSFIVSIGFVLYLSFYSKLKINSVLLFFIVFILIFLTGLVNILISFDNRFGHYKIISKVYFIRVAMQNILMILFGLLRSGSIGLLFSQIFGMLFGFKKQISSIKETKIQLSFNKIKLKKCLIQHKKQAKFATPAAFFNSFSYSSINVFVENLFGSGVLGLYSISFRVLGLPLGIIGTNVSKVFYEKAAYIYKEKGTFKKIYLKMIICMTLISIPIGLCLALFSPIVVETIFGESWYNAGIYIRILTPMFMLRLISSTVNTSTTILERQQLELTVQTVLIIFSVICFVVAKVFSISILGYLQCINIAFSLVYVIYLSVVYKCL